MAVFDQEVRFVLDPALAQIELLKKELRDVNSLSKAIKIAVEASAARKVFKEVRDQQKDLTKGLTVQIKALSDVPKGAGFGSEGKYGPSGWGVKGGEDYLDKRAPLEQRLSELNASIRALTARMSQATQIRNAAIKAAEPPKTVVSATPELSANEQWYASMNAIGARAEAVAMGLQRLQQDIQSAHLRTDFAEISKNTGPLAAELTKLEEEIRGAFVRMQELENIDPSRLQASLNALTRAQEAAAAVVRASGGTPVAPSIGSEFATGMQGYHSVLADMKSKMLAMPSQTMEQINQLTGQIKAKFTELQRAYQNANNKTDFKTLREGLKKVEAEAEVAIAKLKEIYDASRLQAKAMGRTMVPAPGGGAIAFSKTAEGAEAVMRMGDVARRAKAEIDRLQSALRSLNNAAATTPARVDRMSKSAKQFSGMLEAWWYHFGRVALGFTLVYRAMNAVGMVFTKVKDEIMGAVKAVGELTALQAKLAMFYTLGSKGGVTFEDAFRRSAGAVMALNEASIHSISTIEELSVAMDEVAQAGVFLKESQMKNFVALVDFTTLVAKTTGNTATQLRSELQALMQGNIRANNILVRFLVQTGALTKEQVKNLKNLSDKTQVFAKVLEYIGPTWQKAFAQITKADPMTAFKVWEKTLQQVLIYSQMVGASSQKSMNIFSDTIQRHTTIWSDLIKKSTTYSQKNNPAQVQQLAVMYQFLNSVLNKALTFFEKIIFAGAKLATIYTNYREVIRGVLGVFLIFETGRGLRWIGWLLLKTNLLSTAWIALKALWTTIAAGQVWATLTTNLTSLVSTTWLWVGALAAAAAAIAAASVGLMAAERYQKQMGEKETFAWRVGRMLVNENKLKQAEERRTGLDQMYYTDSEGHRKPTWSINEPPEERINRVVNNYGESYLNWNDVGIHNWSTKGVRAKWIPTITFHATPTDATDVHNPYVGQTMPLEEVMKRQGKAPDADIKTNALALSSYVGQPTEAVLKQYGIKRDDLYKARAPQSYQESLQQTIQDAGSSVTEMYRGLANEFLKMVDRSAKPRLAPGTKPPKEGDLESLGGNGMGTGSDDEFKKLMAAVGGLGTGFLEKFKSELTDSTISLADFTHTAENAKEEAKLNISRNEEYQKKLSDYAEGRKSVPPDDAWKMLSSEEARKRARLKLDELKDETERLKKFAFGGGFEDVIKMKSFNLFKDLVGELNTNFQELAKEGISDSSVSMERYLTIIEKAKKAANDEIALNEKRIASGKDLLEKNQVPDEFKGKSDVDWRAQIEDRLAYLKDRNAALQEFLSSEAIEFPKIKSLEAIKKDFTTQMENLKTYAGEQGIEIPTYFGPPSMENPFGFQSGTAQYQGYLRGVISETEGKVAPNADVTSQKGRSSLAGVKADLKEATLATYGWKEGIEDALKELANPRPFEMFRTLTQDCFAAMTDAIMEFVKTGKISWRSFVDAILEEFLRMQIQMQLIAPLTGWLNSWNPFGAANAPTATPSPATRAGGGLIDEHVVGVGLRTGRKWEFGEEGPEIVHSTNDSFSSISTTIARAFTTAAYATTNKDQSELVSAVQQAAIKDRQSLASITERIQKTDKKEIKEATKSSTSFKEFFKKGDAPKKRALGGVIDEHVIGIGESGKKWEFGELGPELVHSTKESLSSILRTIVSSITSSRDRSSERLSETIRQTSASDRSIISTIANRIQQTQLSRASEQISSREHAASQINNILESVNTSHRAEHSFSSETSEVEKTNSEAKKEAPGVIVNVHNAPHGTTVNQSYDQHGNIQLDVMIDQIMSQKLVRGKSARVLQGVYGQSPRVFRR